MSAMATPEIFNHSGLALFQPASEGVVLDHPKLDPAKTDFSALFQAQLQPQPPTHTADFALGLRQNLPLEAAGGSEPDASDGERRDSDELASLDDTTISPLILGAGIAPIAAALPTRLAANSIAVSIASASQSLPGSTRPLAPDQTPAPLAGRARQAPILANAQDATPIPPLEGGRRAPAILPEIPNKPALADIALSLQSGAPPQTIQTPPQPLANTAAPPQPDATTVAAPAISVIVSADVAQSTPVRAVKPLAIKPLAIKPLVAGLPGLANPDSAADLLPIAPGTKLSAIIAPLPILPRQKLDSASGNVPPNDDAPPSGDNAPALAIVSVTPSPTAASNSPVFEGQLRTAPGASPLANLRSNLDPAPSGLAIETQALGPVTVGIAASAGSDALRVHFAVEHPATAQIFVDASMLLGQRLELVGARLEALSVDVRSEQRGDQRSNDQYSNEQRPEQRQAGEFQQNSGQNPRQGESGNSAQPHSGGRAQPLAGNRNAFPAITTQSSPPSFHVTRDRFA